MYIYYKCVRIDTRVRVFVINICKYVRNNYAVIIHTDSRILPRGSYVNVCVCVYLTSVRCVCVAVIFVECVRHRRFSAV